MANSPEKHATNTEADLGRCEYVPFGAEDKITLSFSVIRKWLAAKTVKGEVPDDHDVMKFLRVCKAKRLNPFDGDAFLVGYDGKDGPVFTTIVAHQAFLKRAETHPEFDGMESGVIVKMGEEIKELVGDFYPDGARLLGGWATVFFVNRRHPMTKRLRLSTFDKGRSLWKTNPEGMIVKCAEADALRSSFPQLIGGMYLREEMESGKAQTTYPRPASLEDRRAEEMAAPFADPGSQKPFSDRSGQPVNLGRSPRYQQDAAAVEATERIRGKQANFQEKPAQSEEEPMVASAPAAMDHTGVFSVLLSKCSSAKSVAAGVLLQREVSAHFESKSITEEQAYGLYALIESTVENSGT